MTYTAPRFMYTYTTTYLEQKFDFQNVFITRIINLIMQHVLYENIDHLLPMYKFSNIKGAPEYQFFSKFNTISSFPPKADF